MESVATLVDALARLDTAHAARALPPDAPEHAAHEAERAALKARLTKLLASARQRAVNLPLSDN